MFICFFIVKNCFMAFRWGQSLGINRYWAKILPNFISNQVTSFNVQIIWVDLGAFQASAFCILVTTFQLLCFSGCVSVAAFCILVSQITGSSMELFLSACARVLVFKVENSGSDPDSTPKTIWVSIPLDIGPDKRGEAPGPSLDQWVDFGEWTSGGLSDIPEGGSP